MYFKKCKLCTAMTFVGHFDRQRLGTWPLMLPDLTPFDYCVCGHMKFLVYAVKLSMRAELLKHIMDYSTHTRDDKSSHMRSVTSLSQRCTMCIDN
jgi:hypothetical protein